MRGANLAVRFFFELCALAAFAYWGFLTPGGTAQHILLGIGAPILMAIVWGAFIAPRAAVALPRSVTVVLGLLVLELAAVALAAAGLVPLAVIFGVAVAINAALIVAWEH